MVCRKHACQRSDALQEFLSKLYLFFLHRNAKEVNGRGSVVSFQGQPVQIDGSHVFVRLQIEDSSDGQVPLKLINIVSGLGMRSNKKPRKDLRVVHSLDADSTQLTARNFIMILYASVTGSTCCFGFLTPAQPTIFTLPCPGINSGSLQQRHALT